VVTRHAGRAAHDLLAGYFAAGDPDELRGLLARAGLTVTAFRTWAGATEVDSLDTFLTAELLPIAEQVPAEVRERIVAECRGALAPFLRPDGGIAAPIEAHLATAVPST
jgi:hypothetical protein